MPVEGQSRVALIGPRQAVAPRDRSVAQSERLEVFDQLVFTSGRQRHVGHDDVMRLAVVAQDRLVEGQRFAVMHQPVASPHAPERSCPHLLLRRLIETRNLADQLNRGA